jgi:hypothetical protein
MIKKEEIQTAGASKSTTYYSLNKSIEEIILRCA